MENRKLGIELTVSALGLGCMGMTYAYGTADEAQSVATLERAIEQGVTFFDTAEMYGPFTNEVLLGRVLKPVRERIVIATKFGFKIDESLPHGQNIVGLDSRPEHVRAVAEASLKRLGTDVIDLYYQHRVDPSVPIEETVGAMADLVREGKVRTLGLSEASAATIRRAHAVHPIAAVQSEYSLWSRDPEENGVFDVCRDLGIGFVPYSPLGRGMLTGAFRKSGDLEANDFRSTLPRFQADVFEANAALVAKLEAMASQRGVTAAQLAIAWVLHQGDFIVPIPGARKVAHLEQNVAAAAVHLGPDELAALGEALDPRKVLGKRYSEESLAMTNL